MLEVTGTAGQVIAGRYRLVEMVGEGGMGCVWRADDLKLGSPAAVKLVRPTVAERPGIRDRFLREAKAAALLRGVNVVQVLDHGVEGGSPFIAMEYLEGESLAARLEREHRLSPTVTARVMAGVARALRRAHKLGVIHRDLKPDNIFLARDEVGEVVKVVDFGIAKVLGPVALDSQERRKTETGVMLGTPCYMSPEQARGRKEMDARSDLWSFAVIAFECLTGRRPFDADALGELMMQICSEPIPPPSSVAEVPPGFDAWFERATQRDPDARFQTVRELSDALSEVLTPGERWTEPSIDSEPEAKPARVVTPLESQPTVADDHPPDAAHASEDATGNDGIDGDATQKNTPGGDTTSGGATGDDATSREAAARSTTGKDEGDRAATGKDSGAESTTGEGARARTATGHDAEDTGSMTGDGAVASSRGTSLPPNTVEGSARAPARRGLLVGAIAAAAAGTLVAVALSNRPRSGDIARPGGDDTVSSAPPSSLPSTAPGAEDMKAWITGSALPGSRTPATAEPAPSSAASSTTATQATGMLASPDAPRTTGTLPASAAPPAASAPGTPGQAWVASPSAAASTTKAPVPSPAPAPAKPSGTAVAAPSPRVTAAPPPAATTTTEPELPREKFE